MNRLESTWWIRRVRRPSAALRVICFPYAGGAPSAFHRWSAVAPEHLEVVVAQLPGRDARIREAPLRTVDAIVAALCREIEPLLDVPLVFFGHSFGALVAFELARALRRAGRPLPVHLCASGSRAPSATRCEEVRPWLAGSDADFVESLATLQRTSRVVEPLRNPELRELLVPTVRADFEAFVAYRHVVEPPLPLSLSVFTGAEDPFVTLADARAWCAHATGGSAVHTLAGDHFFLVGRERTILEEIDDDLRAANAATLRSRHASTAEPPPSSTS